MQDLLVYILTLSERLNQVQNLIGIRPQKSIALLLRVFLLIPLVKLAALFGAKFSYDWPYWLLSIYKEDL
jgi:hypothetical protein